MDEPAPPTRLNLRPATGGASGSATRLLILGCVRIFQPVHGYFLRRELISWQIDEWASVHPGSIYNALRSLTRSGLLEEVQTGSAGARPARTTYQLTPAGEHEFLTLLRAALRGTGDPTAFLTAVNMAYALPRDEVVEAVSAHADELEEHLERAGGLVAEILAAPDTPNTATEVLRILSARTGGELAWARDYLERLRGGEYSFVGEEPDWRPTEAQVAEALEAGVGFTGRPAPHTR